jgi:hypothetical protein
MNLGTGAEFLSIPNYDQFGTCPQIIDPALGKD